MNCRGQDGVEIKREKQKYLKSSPGKEEAVNSLEGKFECVNSVVVNILSVVQFS